MPSYSSIRIRNLHFEYDIDNIIFDNVSFTISPNEKVAIMGKNGAGKSTLCKMLAGDISDYSGEITIDKHVKLAYVGQQMPEKYLHWTVQDFLFDARDLLKPLKDYFLVVELLAFDKGFEGVCLNGCKDNLINKSWTLNECIKAFDNFLTQQDLPEIHMSEECAVELMLEIEEMELLEIGDEKELFRSQALKYLRHSPHAENTLEPQEFMRKFLIYFEFLKQKSMFQFFIKSQYMERIITMLGDLQELYEHKGGHELETDIHEALTIVHLEKLGLHLPIQMLSGGQKNRLLLAHSVLQNPDILILDEPTNNLDTYSYQRLTQFVKTFKSTLIVISHDAGFLNTFVQKVLYIDSFQHGIREYCGTYLEVKQEIALQMSREKKQEHRIRSELKKTKEVYTARAQQAQVYSGSKALARGAQQLKKKIENLEAEKITKLKEDQTISRFSIPCEIIDDSLLSIDTMSYWKGDSSEDFLLNFELPKSAVVLIHG
ncbi:ABC-F family ATP-binding cassette domain-containing protein, partial [Candidatus Peregrinibacteria bacterium]|nr:ABC-F family ATP-binding cassette domain-containing protein [Candidatus Peregrinibacteria bacterium]